MRTVLLAVVLGVLFLHIFYRAIESQWPQVYFGGSTATHAVNASPVRYLAFRFLPVFATCLFVAVSIGRIGDGVTAAVFGVVVGHASLTTLRGLVTQTFGADSGERSTPLVLLQIVVTVGFVLVALLAIYARSSLDVLVPPVTELAASLWTAVLAGVVGAYLVKVATSGAQGPERLLARSRSGIAQALWQYSEQEAERMSTDPDLIHALMLVENLARPAWFRRIERLKGLVFKQGTYGIMQVESAAPISDHDSVDLALRKLSGVGPFINSKGYVDYAALRSFAKTYNDDGDYADLVIQAYTNLRGRRAAP
jgi:hypothetical protein